LSVQFGRWNYEGQPPSPDYIERVRTALAPYGPDSDEKYSEGGLIIRYRAFHTTKQSRSEKQPHISPSGAVITWDGRLDNRPELISNLRDHLTNSSTDLAIVAAAYEKWDTKCFAKLIGDWALSIWNPNSRSLLLAKDPIGARHLYYLIDDTQVTWSTILDPLVLLAGRTLTLNEEYIAGWLSYFPAAHLTPYDQIQSLPSSSFVLLRPGEFTVRKYWDFDPAKQIRYRTNAEYEDHFRTIFAQAVHRRLRSERPVLAELSGGLDSASVVCMADTVIARGGTEPPRLDTISWYDDSYEHIEPDTNELHWILKVEEKRGRTGCHINLGSLRGEAESRTSFASEFDDDRFAATPSPNKQLSEHYKQYADYMSSQGYRVTLSGIGGDEVTCGELPTPILELRNYLARARWGTLVHQLGAWSAKMGKPPIPWLWEAVRGFFCRSVTGTTIDMRPAPWLRRGFSRRNRVALCGYPCRVKLFGPLPSFQENIATLNVVRRLLANWTQPLGWLREVRFPYLDRDLLEFVFAIPREQIVGVGKRRFLMKRALVGIVPEELLNRRRKAFVRQGPEDFSPDWACLIAADQHLVASSRGFIHPHRFLKALLQVRRGEIPVLGVRRTVILERWLRQLTVHGVLPNATVKRDRFPHCLLSESRAARPRSSAS
jgi:asparagine synthase (glutamine-hydrolysing)